MSENRNMTNGTPPPVDLASLVDECALCWANIDDLRAKEILPDTPVITVCPPVGDPIIVPLAFWEIIMTVMLKQGGLEADEDRMRQGIPCPHCKRLWEVIL